MFLTVRLPSVQSVWIYPTPYNRPGWLEPPLKFQHWLQGSQVGLYLQTKGCKRSVFPFKGL